MSTDPNEQPSIPNEADETNSTQAAQPQDDAPAGGTPDPAQPVVTQGNMTDGAGQRGGYGDSDQTNGMEGGSNAKPDVEQKQHQQ